MRGRRVRPGLLTIWLLLAALVATIGIIEWRDRAGQPTAPAADARRLLPVPVSELGAVEIADGGVLHRFERDASGAWFDHGAHGGAEGAHRHDPDPAQAARIDRVLAAFERARIEREVPLPREGDPYGVAAPELVILAYRPGASQPLVQYAVGHVAADTVSRYVLVVGRRTVATIPGYQIDNLRTLIRPGSPEASPGRR